MKADGKTFDIMTYNSQMNVYEYFDYENQLIDDLLAVKASDSRSRLANLLRDTLLHHKQQFQNSHRDFSDRIAEYRAALMQMSEGKTPDMVKIQMEKYGFKDLEEDKSSSIHCFSQFQNAEESQAEKTKRLCRTEDDGKPDSMKPRRDMTDEEADMQNAKIFSAISNDCCAFDKTGKPFPADKFFKTADNAKEKAKSDVKEIVGDEKLSESVKFVKKGRPKKPSKPSKSSKLSKARLEQEKPE